MSKIIPLDKIANQIGYLVLKDDGAVIESGGELQNDEKSANIIMGLIQMTERFVKEPYDTPENAQTNPSIPSVDEDFLPKSGCERISIMYDDHSYVICMSNKKIYVVKRKHFSSNAPDADAANAVA